MIIDDSRIRVRAAYAGFAVFGGFWGAWGASVPAVRDQAGLSDGQLGTALLFVGVGALPAMLLTGRAVDRWGHRVTALLLLLLSVAGVAVAVTAQGLVSLSVGLAVLGATSGGADVAINAAAGSAEQETGRPVITRAHGVFSAAVVVASLSSGLLRAVGVPIAVPFLVVVLGAGGAGVLTLGAAGARRDGREAPDRFTPEPGSPASLRLLALLTIGGLGALAFAVENAHQSWSAVYLGDVLRADPALAAVGPALFAAVVALTRFAVGASRVAPAAAVLTAGAATASVGTMLVAIAGTVTIALIGLGLAAAGTAVLFPTLLSLVHGQVDEAARGAATSSVAAVAYLGFLAGPVYVGRWAAAVDLPGAMVAVAALAVLLAVLAWPAVRTVSAGSGSTRPGPASVRPRRPSPDTSARSRC